MSTIFQGDMSGLGSTIEEAKIKAKKIPVEKWDELQKESDSGFVIDDVEEVEE